MIITLKDGSAKEYSEPKSIIEIAADISEGLARMACAGEVNGEVEDLRTVIDKDCNLSILTSTMKVEKQHSVTQHPISCTGHQETVPGYQTGHRTVHRRRILL